MIPIWRGDRGLVTLSKVECNQPPYRDARWGSANAHAEGAYPLRRQRPARLEQDVKLRGYVVARLSEGWTPEQISGRLAKGIEIGLNLISTEAIYAWVYSKAPKADALWRYLTRGRLMGKTAAESGSALMAMVKRLAPALRGSIAFKNSHGLSEDCLEMQPVATFLKHVSPLRKLVPVDPTRTIGDFF